MVAVYNVKNPQNEEELYSEFDIRLTNSIVVTDRTDSIFGPQREKIKLLFSIRECSELGKEL